MIELMVTVAILGILIAMSAAALGGLQPRAHLASAGSEINVTLRSAKDRAAARNHDVWFGWFPAQDANSVTRYVVVDAEGEFDPTTLASTAPADIPGARQWNAFDIRLRPASGAMFGNEALIPEPYRTVPLDQVGDDGCSFCDSGTGQGWIRFLPSGEVRFFGQLDQTIGGAIVLTSIALQGEVSGNDVRLVTITQPFGLVSVFRNQ